MGKRKKQSKKPEWLIKSLKSLQQLAWTLIPYGILVWLIEHIYGWNRLTKRIIFFKNSLSMNLMIAAGALCATTLLAGTRSLKITLPLAAAILIFFEFSQTNPWAMYGGGFLIVYTMMVAMFNRIH